MFENILNSTETSITFTQIAICAGVALACGLVIALTYLFSNSKYSKSFAVALVILPILVQMVIMIVNGNLGTGIAIAGAFALIRFRSVAAGAKDICTIFFAMVIGLVVGAGYVGYAAIFTIFLCLLYLLLSKTKFANPSVKAKELSITIPEDLDYTGVFDEVFAKYTVSHELEKVKTTNLGSMYKLSYHVVLKDPKEEKKFIDDLRCRNGNLTIVCSEVSQGKEEL